MATPDWERVKTIVNAYHEEEPADPEAWLDARCDGDEALRAEVESLLEADAEGRLSDDDRALDRVADKQTGTGPTLSDLHPDVGSPVGPDGQIGPYHLLDEIGVGGTSVVYRAERVGAPFEQTVAVKVLQRRLHADDAERRFRAEQQVLASLDHPNIAQLIDGGVTEGGRPYLVMEYVDGTPITEYVQEHNLDLSARLDLLRQVMEAVRAAHESLVVHRDLKPSNVLVTDPESGAPQVKLLDFGIAKLLDDTLPVTQPRTQTGHRLLTPAYAAPEQLAGDGEVSTRTDVYQLGALAYEVLAGTQPFDLSDKSLTEIEAVVAEDTPPKPSERATEEGVRETDLQGDLDVILRKALRKEPDRRYRSVGAFMEDLRRYRAGEPVHAQPATATYRARKFLERNAVAVAVAAGFVLLAAGFLAFHIHQITEERNRAQREAQKAEQVSAYLTDLLQSTRPDETAGETVTAEDMLERGRRRINQLDDQPAVQARMLQLLGNAHRERGNYEKAAGLLRRSLNLRDSLYGRNHRAVANTLEELGHVQRQRERYDRADSLFRASLSIQRTVFGAASPKLWEPLNNMGIAAEKQGNYARADSLYRTALTAARTAAAPDTGKLTNTLQNRAVLAHNRGQLETADSLYRRVLALGRQVHDAPHPFLATVLANLGRLHSGRGRYAAADSVLRRSVVMQRAVYNPPHPKIASALDGLAILRVRQKRLGAADSLFREAVAMKRQTLGAQHPSTGLSIMNRATVLKRRGQLADAVPLYRTARAIFRDALPSHHVRAAHVNAKLGQVLAALDRYSAAVSSFKEALDAYRRNGKEKRVREVRANLSDLYTEWGKPEKAATYRQNAEASPASE